MFYLKKLKKILLLYFKLNKIKYECERKKNIFR